MPAPGPRAAARPRRYDPERRQRIIDAAIRVVAERGIAGLSHRNVAAEANVPLGSTTYHFASRDDLLVAALGQISDEWLAGADRWERSVDPGRPLAEEIARLVEESLHGDRARATLEYELYLAALNHRAVRPLAAKCLGGLTAVLRRRTADDESARALAALVDGLILQLLLTDRAVDRTEISALVAPLTARG